MTAADQVQEAITELRRVEARLRPSGLMPPIVPLDDPRRKDWTEAVYVRGEAPFGRCVFCDVARSPAGCLNLCEMPSGYARAFNAGLQAVIAKSRADHHLLEVLGGCTCPPPNLTGYQSHRESHETQCPMQSPDELDA